MIININIILPKNIKIIIQSYLLIFSTILYSASTKGLSLPYKYPPFSYIPLPASFGSKLHVYINIFSSSWRIFQKRSKKGSLFG